MPPRSRKTSTLTYQSVEARQRASNEERGARGADAAGLPCRGQDLLLDRAREGAMRFLALSAQAAYALLAAVTVVILLLYVLKPRTRRVTVSSMLLWRRMLARRRPGAARWRWLLSLFLALGAGLSIALALTRPELPGVGGVDRTYRPGARQLAIDGGAHDGRQEPLAPCYRAGQGCRATGWRGQPGAGDGYHGLRGVVWIRPPRSCAREPRAAAGRDLRHAAYPASAGRRRRPARFTCSPMAWACLIPPTGVQVHSSFEPVDNVAVTAFEVRPLVNDPTRCQAFVQILNASPTAKRVNLVVAGEPRFTRCSRGGDPCRRDRRGELRYHRIRQRRAASPGRDAGRWVRSRRCGLRRGCAPPDQTRNAGYSGQPVSGRLDPVASGCAPDHAHAARLWRWARFRCLRVRPICSARAASRRCAPVPPARGPTGSAQCPTRAATPRSLVGTRRAR